jgi:formylglycine-generating enzyme required for sulfatase activity/tetratricopeptide (TPR) repeat protein
MELTPQHLARLDEMGTLLRISSDCTIAFVRCNEPILCDSIYGSIKRKISDEIFIYQIEMNKDSTNLLHSLNEAVRTELYNSKIKDNRKVAFFIFGLDMAIEKKTRDGRSEALMILNLMRENFLNIKHTIIIWINNSTLSAILKEAPDFFSWRTTVFEFDIKKEERTRLISYFGEKDLEFLNRNELEEIWKNYSNFLSEYQEKGIEDAMKFSHWNFSMGTIKLLTDHADEATGFFEKSLNYSEKSGDKKGVANSTGMLGNAYFDADKVEKAIEYYEKALLMAREIGDRSCEGNSLENLRLAYSSTGRVEKANEYYEKIISLRLLQRMHPLRIVVGYSLEDKPAAREIYRRLRVEGFDPWLDEENLLPGQNWEIEIQKAVCSSDAIIVCLSKIAVKEGFILKEIKYVIDEAYKLPKEKILIIPIKLKECDIPGELARWHSVNLFEEHGFERVLRLLNGIRLQPYINSIGMKFALIPAGEFMMGSPADEKGVWEEEGQVHNVKISKQFYLGIYPVTQQQWKILMGENPSYFKGDNLPVENVSWDNILRFIIKLNEKEGSDKYRLPSEAEWEYAVRGDTRTRYYFGDDESELDDYAWYLDNSEGRTHPVGQKKPNQWGLYDMHGNVWEWVQDKWHRSYDDAPEDGSAWESGDVSFRVVRGGSWGFGAWFCRSAIRMRKVHSAHGGILGFRLLRIL